MLGHRCGPSGIIQVQQSRGRRLVDRIHPRFLLKRMHPCAILIFDRVPTGQTARSYLIIQHDRKSTQVIKERFQIVLKKAEPMFNTRMLSASRNCLVQRVIRPSGAKFDPIVLTEPSNRRVIQDHFRYRRQFDLGQLLSRALRRRIKSARAIQHISKQIQPYWS